jgi:hypothetical protein
LAFLRNTPGGRSNKLTGKYANGFSVYNISRFAIIGKIEPERLSVVDNLATESTMKDNSWGDEWDKMVVKHSLLAISSEFEDMGSMDDALFWSKRQVIMAALIFALCSANKPSITAEAAEDNDRDSTKQSANSNIVSDTPKPEPRSHFIHQQQTHRSASVNYLRQHQTPKPEPRSHFIH